MPERRLSSLKCSMFSQRTQVQLPAPTLGGQQPPEILVLFWTLWVTPHVSQRHPTIKTNLVALFKMAFLSWNSLCTPDWPQTQGSTCLCFQSAGMKGVGHHTQLLKGNLMAGMCSVVERWSSRLSATLNTSNKQKSNKQTNQTYFL